jgi:hypothetical protein
MGNVLEIFAEMISVVADNPASILIVLGFLGILIAIFFPMGLITQLLLGGTGFVMLIAGIFVHVIWLQR